MAHNIERVLFSSTSMVVTSSLIVGPNGTWFKGTMPIFWPRNEAGTFGQDRTLVEFRVLLSNGHDVSIGTNLETTTNGLTFSFDASPMERETRLLKLVNTGDLGVARITAIFVDWPTQADHIADLETKVADHEARIVVLEAKP